MDEPIRKKIVAACVVCLGPMNEIGACACTAAPEFRKQYVRASLEGTAARRELEHAEAEVRRLRLMLRKAKGDVAVAELRRADADRRVEDLGPKAFPAKGSEPSTYDAQRRVELEVENAELRKRIAVFEVAKAVANGVVDYGRAALELKVVELEKENERLVARVIELRSESEKWKARA